MLNISLLFSGCKSVPDSKPENKDINSDKTPTVISSDLYEHDKRYICTDFTDDDLFYCTNSMSYSDGKLYISGFVISDNGNTPDLIVRSSSGDTVYEYSLEKDEQFYFDRNLIYTFRRNDDMIISAALIDTETGLSEETDISKYKIPGINLVTTSDNSVFLLDKNSVLHIFSDNFSSHSKSDISEYLHNSYRLIADEQKNLYVFTADDDETILYKFDDTLDLVYKCNNYSDMPGSVYNVFIENDELNISTISDGFIYTNVIDSSNGETILRKDIYQYSSPSDDISENESFIGTCSDGKTVVLKYPDIQEYYCTLVKDENNNVIEERKLTTDKSNIISVIENCKNGDTLYIEETYDKRDFPDENIDAEHIIHRLGSNGTNSSVTLTSYNSENYPLALKTDSQGDMYIAERKENSYQICRFNEQGKLIYQKEYSSDILSFSGIILINDELYINYMSYDEKYILQRIDENGDLKEKKENILFTKIYPGNELFDLFTTDGKKIYGYNFDTNEFSEILSLINCGMQLAPSDFFEYKDNFVLRSKGSYYLLNDDESASSKQIIKLSGIELSYEMKSRILNFNSLNDKYIIECVDYNFDEDSLKKLNMDIISRKTDMVVFNNRNSPAAENYNSFLFTDLSEYIYEDPDINKDDYFFNIIDLFKNDGKLYKLTTEFNIYTMVSKRDNNNFFSIDLNEFLSENIKVSEHRYGLASNILSAYINNKNFTDDKFRSVLKYLKENVYDVDEGRKVNFGFCEPDENTFYGCILTPYFFHSDPSVSYFGFPTINGNGIVAESTESFSVLDNSKNKDGAWEFIKYCLSDDYQESLYRAIPVKKSAFEKAFKGETSEEKERCMNIIENADCKYIGNTTLFNIIWEEAELYFNDMMSLDETVNAIKQKTMIYFSETEPSIF